MKISQEQKRINRKNIIAAAVDLIIEKGFQDATMRQIARQAGMGDATIYNYFPTKEAILFGYYEDHMHACIAELKTIESLHTFSLQEQLESLFDTSLALYLPDREFVAATFRQVMLTGSRDWKRLKPIRSVFLAAIRDMLSAAAEVGEIPDPVFEDLISQLFMDGYLGLIVYWLGDDSDAFAHTSVLQDHCLDLACALLKVGLANKVFDVIVFLFKTHVIHRMDALMAPLPNSDGIKRRFMEGANEG